MPKVEVPGFEPFETTEGTKLVLALEDNGIDILHRCGGKAKCTTCRVEVHQGDFEPPGEKELAKSLEEGCRLSCQIRVTSDVKVTPKMTVSSTGMDPGPRPEK
ncbi:MULTISPECIES: 2Fe-2S iron-sulfur cluster-binding protein [Alteribacter]|uniref:(2Fe-2S)-binding protein n=1 Tax=Alteribacter keqinensis TaxID=2483800 RepID=A0A3M7TV19_9BACI|nr:MULTISPECIES: 2Fe-2S iron-sulfur cluster-binding protein [Alteribacter]MBM7094363.1 (2Fe-2S)-binding protein [Alteribacter salitolerans]RNA69407.1 (2Fe-2S)-binding protein [Alteribacter keqinensis]